MTKELVPKEVTLSATMKAWKAGDQDGGVSSGSEITTVFHVPDDMDMQEFKRAALRAQLALDTHVLYNERARGAITLHLFRDLKETLVTNFKKMIGDKDEDKK